MALRRFMKLLMLLTLISGLPAVAYAHGGYQHAVLEQSAAPGWSSGSLTPSDVEAVQAILVSHADDMTSQTIGPPAEAFKQVVFARHLVSPADAGRSCAGDCCCTGKSSCGSASCCPLSLAAHDNALSFPAAGLLSFYSDYPSAELMVILGLDRPPKA